MIVELLNGQWSFGVSVGKVIRIEFCYSTKIIYSYKNVFVHFIMHE